MGARWVTLAPMSTTGKTPQFSVRLRRDLLARIDTEVQSTNERLSKEFGTYGGPKTTRTDVIVQLIREAFLNRDQPPPPEPVAKPARTPEETAAARKKRLAKFKSPASIAAKRVKPRRR